MPFDTVNLVTRKGIPGKIAQKGLPAPPDGMSRNRVVLVAYASYVAAATALRTDGGCRRARPSYHERLVQHH